VSEDAIVLVAYDPGWPAAYILARQEIVSLLPTSPLLVEHVGSTAVPGLMSKPVIDIIVLVADMAPARAAIPSLARIGYEFRPDVSNPTRLFFRRYGTDGVRTHHLHIHTDCEDVQRHVLFRDRLRSDAATRRDYEALKHDLARRHPSDREAYAKGKDDFIDAVVRAAGGPERRPFWKA
jgi:GrpB-like predicted nucleotidyltransferase (UPF0157 family)